MGIQLPTPRHYRQLLCGTTSDSILHVIREITLQHPHCVPFVIRKYVSGQLTRGTSVHRSEIRFAKRFRCVPAIYFRFPFIPKEYCSTIIRTNYDESVGFSTDLFKRFYILEMFIEILWEHFPCSMFSKDCHVITDFYCFIFFTRYRQNVFVTSLS